MPKADTPIFNLNAVVQETGIKPDTLRAWERRYGLPNPQRSEGGHRLYSLRDIEIVKWLLEQRETGLSISKAVKLWRQLETERDSDRLLAAAEGPKPVPSAQGEGTLSERRQAWSAACMDFDARSARRVLAESFALFSVEDVCFGILLPGVAQMGQDWYAGSVTVQQEHFATEIATRQLEALLAATPEPTRTGRHSGDKPATGKPRVWLAYAYALAAANRFGRCLSWGKRAR